jgi:hypothetical protein
MKKDFDKLNSFEVYEQKYKPLFKSMKHEFSVLAPYERAYGNYKTKEKHSESKSKTMKKKGVMYD